MLLIDPELPRHAAAAAYVLCMLLTMRTALYALYAAFWLQPEVTTLGRALRAL